VLTRDLAPGSASSSASAASRTPHQIELPLVRVLRFMEVAGIKLDTARLARARDRINADAAQLEREIWELAGRSS
jgi:DNA polymerase I-like protein with 3'-5' exonuclease and polymerase domains